MRTILIALTILVAAAALWVAWRLRSRQALLPCPSDFAWLVEVENPLARATRSEEIVRRLAPAAGACVIDIGCGPGRVTLPLARAVGPTGEVTALDLQSDMLAKVAAKAAHAGLANIRLLQSDMDHCNVPPDSLDAAAMVMALGEIPERLDALSTVRRLLKPGGRLLIAESIFDPHYVRRSRVREKAKAAGLVERDCAGSLFAYGILFEKPDTEKS